VLLAELRDAVRGRSGEEGLRAFVGCMLDFFWRRHQLAVLMHSYEHRLREPSGVEWRARRAAMVALARGLLASEIRAGRLATRDAALATEMLLALIRAAVLSERNGDRPTHAGDLVVQLFLHGIGGAGVRRGRAARGARAAGGRR
jgi:hypothetical protein